MPSAWTLLCASLYARLHIDRSSSGASWNQTFGGAISVDAIEADLGGYPEDAHVVLHVTHTFVPEQCNATVGRGSTVGVYYTCSIADDSEAGQPGTLIANNSADPEPLYVLVGVGEIVRGWELGLIGLCEGEGVTLRVPPELAFGDHGDGGAIPPRATLTFSTRVTNC